MPVLRLYNRGGHEGCGLGGGRFVIAACREPGREAGERKAARSTLKQASDGDDGLVVAMIDLADLDVDDGALDEGFALYDKALAKAKDHPLAVLGKSLARAESAV